jgi:hypothetical protein
MAGLLSEDFLTTDEAAEYTRLGATTLSKIARGEYPGVTLPRNRIGHAAVYRKSDLDEVIRQWMKRPKSTRQPKAQQRPSSSCTHCDRIATALERIADFVTS